MPGEFYIEDKKLKSDLTEIKNTVTNIQNNVTQIQNDVTTIVTSSGGGVVCADFWSETVDEAEVELDAAGETKELPPVVVEKIPVGAAVLRAIAIFKFRMIENKSEDSNRLNGGTDPGLSQVIQVRESVTPGPWGDAVNFVNSQYEVEGETREGGDVCFGSIDISGIITGNGLYEFQWLLARALEDYLSFYDVQVGIRVWYSMASS